MYYCGRVISRGVEKLSIPARCGGMRLQKCNLLTSKDFEIPNGAKLKWVK
jgi:hypothetical protein